MQRRNYIPSRYEFVIQGDHGIELWKDPERPVAVAFSGRRRKPDWHYRFKTEEALRDYVRGWKEGIQQQHARKAEVRARRNAPHDVEVGNVFCCSWGYDQTNIDYYEVVALNGQTQATVRPIAALAEPDEWLQGDCTPRPGHYTGEPFRVRIQGGTQPYFRAYSFAVASRITPTAEVAGVKTFAPSRFSAYA